MKMLQWRLLNAYQLQLWHWKVCPKWLLHFEAKQGKYSRQSRWKLLLLLLYFILILFCRASKHLHIFLCHKSFCLLKDFGCCFFSLVFVELQHEFRWICTMTSEIDCMFVIQLIIKFVPFQQHYHKIWGRIRRSRILIQSLCSKLL